MSENGYKLYINGEWVSAKSNFTDYNPASGDVWAEIPDGTGEDTRNAIEAAAAAQAEWVSMPHPQRASYLLKVADILEKQRHRPPWR